MSTLEKLLLMNERELLIFIASKFDELTNDISQLRKELNILHADMTSIYQNVRSLRTQLKIECP